MIGATAELALATGDDALRVRAQSLATELFDGPLFDGRFLVHDVAADGGRAREHCSGCNWNALHLVDRLWGDTWRVAPLPSPPDRASGQPEWTTSEHDLYVLRARQRGTYGLERMSLTLEYDELAPDAEHPRGALRVELSWSDGPLSRRCRRAQLVELDSAGAACADLASMQALEGEWPSEQVRAELRFGVRIDGGRAIRLVESRCADEGS